jgi:hypothetical protein
MGITNNLKISWKNDLWQAIGEQDVLKLRRQLCDIWKLSETGLKNYMMTTFQH